MWDTALTNRKVISWDLISLEEIFWAVPVEALAWLLAVPGDGPVELLDLLLDLVANRLLDGLGLAAPKVRRGTWPPARCCSCKPGGLAVQTRGAGGVG